ncbi:Hypothetical Protein FCC1311_033152 [Hondaea fermentalgiana]|uniref:Uncharacterized protein n=1 Tax=Hondaea fermentalgiana TaxID=2315210 RepID=A0A2R5G7R7_9STRA|nr:Hypothetical Protein FCC1311_033152 [Hondaea fermentalgiana]|eukprot:GBG27092.1 Hypothetical Protein FCC1311_033152 [Hondaea fermentalgiana]
MAAALLDLEGRENHGAEACAAGAHCGNTSNYIALRSCDAILLFTLLFDLTIISNILVVHFIRIVIVHVILVVNVIVVIIIILQ